VKNLNSIRNVKRAIETEVIRQIELVESGGRVQQQTRGYNADTNTTTPQRDKEEANDYRYFTCPDLPPFEISQTQLDKINSELPELPEALLSRYTTILNLPVADAIVLTEEKGFSDYFNELVKETPHSKAAANWMLGPVKSWLNSENKTISEWPLSATALAAVIALVQGGNINFSVASSKLLPALLQQPEADATELAKSLNLLQSADSDELEGWVNEVMSAMPDKVQEYKKGKKGLIGLFVGEVKKRSKGKADPQKTTQLLQEKLK
jgi:aspartyl-tRNA(Asn)/glutamyl-tRNA(Gln) amidotransferase subunit B